MITSRKIAVSQLIKEGKLYIGDGYRAKNSELAKNGYPFARAGNLNDGFQFESADCISFDKIKKVGVKKSMIGDVAFTSKGTIGRFGFVKPTTQEFVYSPQVCFWRSLDKDVIDPMYLYYWMNSHLFLNQVAMVSSQTDMALYVNLRDQRKMWIDLPPLSIQKRIASFLTAYDDLIENNNQRIKLLEEMAEEIYKEWFVRLRFPGYQDSKFFDQEGKEIEHGTPGALPEGWERVKLENRFYISLGGTPSRNEEKFWGGDVPWINSGKVNNLRIIEPSEFITGLGLQKSATKLLSRKTTLLAITGATLGQVSFLEIDSCTNQSIVGIKDPNNEIDEYVYLAIKEKIKDLMNFASGGAQQHINKKIVDEAEIIIATQSVMGEFTRIIKPQFDLIANLLFKNQILQETRDLLLPRLISGKLNVEDLEMNKTENLPLAAEPIAEYNS